jgi:hypothetical protein
METPSELSIYPCTLYGRHRLWSADGTYHRVLDELRQGSGCALMRRSTPASMATIHSGPS